MLNPLNPGFLVLKESLSLFTKRRLIVVLLLGFVSGLPLLLSFGTLSAWLRESDIDRSAIGLFSLVGLPYALKPLWAPFLDGIKLPIVGRLFGRRRSWILVTQFLLMFSIGGLAFCDPINTPVLMAILAVLVAFFSASQDIVIDAYRIETLSDSEQGIGAAMVTYGYRVGMLVAGAGTLVLADHWGWTQAYLIMASLIVVGIATIALSPEPIFDWDADLSETLLEKGQPSSVILNWFSCYVVAPFSEFTTRPGWLIILLFVITFKLGDAFLSVMTNPFYIDLGFTKTEIAEVTKLFGVVALAVGLFIGGFLIQKIGLLPALLVTGILQAISNIFFAFQAVAGYDLGVLTLTIAIENITGGMGTAAFVAYLSNLTNVSFTATQYALLSALMALGRNLLSSPSGYVVDLIGWFDFFIFSIGVAVPGLLCLLILMWRFPNHVGRRTA